MLKFKISVYDWNNRYIGNAGTIKIAGRSDKYTATYTMKGQPKFESTITHHYTDGAVVLIAKATRALARKLLKFYSYPKKDILRLDRTDCVLVSKIPLRYRSEFMDWMCGQTCAVTKDNQSAVYVYDLQRWLTNKISNTCLVFD